jgi:hypothetical protein
MKDMTASLMHAPLFRADDPQTANRWRTADDRVMGGESVAHMDWQHLGPEQGVCLRGDVSLANRGGFIQIKWPVAPSTLNDIDQSTGLYIQASGNGESYNIHVRTRSLWLPWQSYRQTFRAQPQPQYHYFPFDAFEPYKTDTPFASRQLKTIAVVAIGRAFTADVCVSEMGFYSRLGDPLD